MGKVWMGYPTEEADVQLQSNNKKNKKEQIIS